MKNRIENLLKVADYLKDSGTKALLEKWLLTCESGKKPLPFIGRFSAGKSSLINALIGTPVLPTARIETTAAITSISNAPTQRAEIVYSDGKKECINIADVQNLRHGNTENQEEDILSIEIEMPCDLLSHGLTIIDSPGMDTIVNNHVRLAQYVMKEAVIVVYVMSGAPTDFDMGILRQLQANGTRVIAVRTHMEEIGTKNEESFIDAIESDEMILATLPQKVSYFPLTTLADATGASKTEFDRFRMYLTKEIAPKIEDIYRGRLSARLDRISERFRDELSRQKSLLVANADKSVSEYEVEIKKLDEAIKRIESSINEMQTKLSREKYNLKAIILDDISDDCEATAKKFRNAIAAAPTQTDESGIERMFQKALALASEDIGARVTSELAKWAEKSAGEISVDLSEIATGLKDLDIEFDSEINLDKVNDISEQQEAAVGRLEALSAQFEEYASYSDARLSEMGVKRDEIQQAIQVLDATHKEAQDAINYLDSNYEPRYISKPSKMGKLMRKIGAAGDIAMLAIPAIGWEKGAAMLAGNAAILTGKTGQLAQMGQKMLTAGSNVAKVMAHTDTAKDVVTLLDMTTKTFSAQQEGEQARNALVKVDQTLHSSPDSAGIVLSPKKPSMFDYLSLSYWFGKFGDWIDPPRQELDREYEERYRQARRACEQKAFETARARIDEERELGRIKDDAEALEMEKRFRQEALTREQAQFRKQIEKLSKKKDEELRRAFADSAECQFKDAVKKIERHIAHRLDNIMDDIYLQILSAASQSAYSQLAQAKIQLESMMEAKASSNADAMAPAAAIDRMIELTK